MIDRVFLQVPNAHDLDTLWSGQYSRRLLQFTLLADLAPRTAPEAARYAGLSRSLSRLERLQKTHPLVFRDVILAPGTGAWLGHCNERLLSGRAPSIWKDGVPLWVDFAHLGAIALATDLAARDLGGSDVETGGLTVAARGGTVLLPGTGRLELGAGPKWQRQHVEDLPADTGTVVLSTNGDDDLADLAVHRSDEFGLEAIGGTSTLRLEVDDPYIRASFGLPRRVPTQPEAREWGVSIRRSLELLGDHHRRHLAVLRTALKALVPMDRTDEYVGSGTASQCAGCVAVSLPSDATTLAEALLHEAEHFLLGALHDLVPLVKPSNDNTVVSPWRGVPRPSLAVLQGAFAFCGVAEFLDEEARAVGGAEGRHLGDRARRHAHEVEAALSSLATSSTLTAIGERGLRLLRSRLAHLSG